MDIAGLMGGFFRAPSLVDYLNSGKQDDFASIGMKSLEAKTAFLQKTVKPVGEDAVSSSFQVNLSEQAKELLAQSDGVGKENSQLSGLQKGGQDFLVSFFDQNDLDIENLSDEALAFIHGLQDVLAGSGANQRDGMTDRLEEGYNPDRKVYTLVGSGVRFRVAIDYAQGRPETLSITDINNGDVETAKISLSRDDNGRATAIEVERTQQSYQSGYLTKLNPLDPLSIPLYAQVSEAAE